MNTVFFCTLRSLARKKKSIHVMILFKLLSRPVKISPTASMGRLYMLLSRLVKISPKAPIIRGPPLHGVSFCLLITCLAFIYCKYTYLNTRVGIYIHIKVFAITFMLLLVQGCILGIPKLVKSYLKSQNTLQVSKV